MAGGFIDSDDSTNLVNTGSIDFSASGGTLGWMYNSGTINFAGGLYGVEKGSGITNLPGGVINFNAPADLVTNAINCRIDNQGLIVVNAGNSTMDLATPYPYDSYVGAPSLTNEGTVEVASGTLLYPSVSLDSGNAIPAGAGYTVDAGASLTTEVPTSITTNNGTVILQGLGAQFPAIAPLATNNGTFEVLSGAIVRHDRRSDQYGHTFRRRKFDREWQFDSERDVLHAPCPGLPGGCRGQQFRRPQVSRSRAAQRWRAI